MTEGPKRKRDERGIFGGQASKAVRQGRPLYPGLDGSFSTSTFYGVRRIGFSNPINLEMYHHPCDIVNPSNRCCNHPAETLVPPQPLTSRMLPSPQGLHRTPVKPR